MISLNNLSGTCRIVPCRPISCIRSRIPLEGLSAQFETDGTGFARFKNQAFDWSIEADGHLRLVFADGEIADYFNFNSLPDGDAIGVVYTKLNGDVISDGFLSVDFF